MGGDLIPSRLESLGILESAARLANSVDRLNRNSRSGRSSLAAAGKSTASGSDTDEVSSISGGSSGCVSCSDDDHSDGESVNSEPTSNRPSLTAASTLVSPSSSRGRKSCDAQRRMSREASALLDFDCPPTSMSKGGRPSRSNSGRCRESVGYLCGMATQVIPDDVRGHVSVGGALTCMRCGRP